MHIKVHILSVWIVDSKDSIIITIICDYRLALEITQRQNTGYYSLIKPYLATPYNISFFSVIDASTISLNCHVLIFKSLLLQVSYSRRGQL